MLMPSQCTMDALQVQSKEVENLDNLPFVDQEKELSQKADGLLVFDRKGCSFEGVAVTLSSSR